MDEENKQKCEKINGEMSQYVKKLAHIDIKEYEATHKIFKFWNKNDRYKKKNKKDLEDYEQNLSKLYKERRKLIESDQDEKDESHNKWNELNKEREKNNCIEYCDELKKEVEITKDKLQNYSEAYNIKTHVIEPIPIMDSDKEEFAKLWGEYIDLYRKEIDNCRTVNIETWYSFPKYANWMKKHLKEYKEIG